MQAVVWQENLSKKPCPLQHSPTPHLTSAFALAWAETDTGPVSAASDELEMLSPGKCCLSGAGAASVADVLLTRM